MTKFRERILSCIISLCMIVSLFAGIPAIAFANDGEEQPPVGPVTEEQADPVAEEEDDPADPDVIDPDPEVQVAQQNIGIAQLFADAATTEEVIDIIEIGGVTPPVAGAPPVSEVTENDQYTGAVAWSPTIPQDGKFAANTTYTATITLAAKTGYTLTGVAENKFEVAGANSVTHSADSGVITAEFPATGDAPTYTVSGTITDSSDSNGIEGAAVTLKDSDDNDKGSATTDSDGKYTISGIPDDTGYKIEVTKEGYIDGGINSIDVSGANVTGQDITLVKKTYGISLGTVAVTFTSKSYKESPGSETITVTNTGNQATGDLTIALSGTNYDSFNLGKTSISSIATTGGQETFTVQPNAGLGVGTYSATVKVSGGNSLEESFTVSFEVTKATPDVTAWPTVDGVTAIKYGQALSALSLTVGTVADGVTGTFAWTDSSTKPGVGTANQSVTFTPDNGYENNYKAVTKADATSVTVEKATPKVTWPTSVGNITYGQKLVASTLTGGSAQNEHDSSNIDGTFEWDSTHNPSTTVPTVAAGPNGYTVTFTPADKTNYQSVLNGSPTPVVVDKDTPKVIWPTIGTLTYGQALSALDLTVGGSAVNSQDNTTLVSGTFTWTYSSITPDAGTKDQSVTFTPDDKDNYESPVANDAFSVVVNQAPGGAVSGAPTVNGTPTFNEISVNPVTNTGGTGQDVEYAISTTSGTTPTGGWQSSTTFTGLTRNTAYYVYARTEENTNYLAGTAKESAQINTATIPYAISIDVTTGEHDFGTISYGAAVPGAKTVTVKNEGDNATGDLTIALSGTNAGSFTLSAYTISSITATGSSATFTVQPKADLDAGNYNATVKVSGGSSLEKSFTVKFVVNKLTPTTADLTYTIPASVQYNAAAQPISVSDNTAGAGLGAITVKYNGADAAPIDANTYAVTVDIEASTNYEAVTGLSLSSSYEITKVSLTWTAGEANDKPYDGTDAATVKTMPTLNGVLPADTSKVQVSTGTIKFASKDVGTKNITVVSGFGITGAAAGNYNLPGTPTFDDADINVATITITADDQSITTGDAMPTFSYQTTGLAVGEALDAQPNLTTTATNTNTAGTFDIEPAGAAVPSGGNYNSTITYVKGKLTIKAPASNSSNNSGSSSGGGGSFSGGGSTTTTTPTPPTSNNVSQTGEVSSTAIQSEAAKTITETSDSSKATLQTKNAESISANTIKALANTAKEAGKDIVVHADTTDANGNVQGRLYVEPEKLTGLTTDLKLGVYTDPAKTQSTKNFFEKFFDNTVSVVRCEQQGSFGAKLRIAAKVDTSKMDIKNLKFFSYNKETNTYTEIIDTGYRIDKNGYVHFSTALGGDIVITDKPLIQKTFRRLFSIQQFFHLKSAKS